MTVGDVQELRGPIDLVDHDRSWMASFDREKERIVAALGESARAIEHVGSTAVPELPAKPIIDIVLVVADSADEEAYVPTLEASGFVLHIREPDWHEHRMFKGSNPSVNLHVFSEGCPEVERMILFRDHLRSDAGDRVRYAQTKRDLAKKKWRYVQDYADAKASIVGEILSRASAELG